MSVRQPTPARTLAATAALGVILLAGCGSGSGSTPAATTTPPASSAAVTTAPATAAPLTVANAWVKAVPDVKKSQMTGIFATITNPGSKAVTITGAQTNASTVTELHETVTQDGQATMRKVEGGIEVAAGGVRELKPGGDHIMAMMLAKPIAVGDVVTVTLTTSTGESIEFDAVAKEFTGANERYGAGSGAGSMSHAPSVSGTAD